MSKWARPEPLSHVHSSKTWGRPRQAWARGAWAREHLAHSAGPLLCAAGQVRKRASAEARASLPCWDRPDWSWPFLQLDRALGWPCLLLGPKGFPEQAAASPAPKRGSLPRPQRSQPCSPPPARCPGPSGGSTRGWGFLIPVGLEHLGEPPALPGLGGGGGLPSTGWGDVGNTRAGGNRSRRNPAAGLGNLVSQ